VAGRAITWTDIYQVKPVIVVSEQLAREHWRQPAAALGKRIGYPVGVGASLVLTRVLSALLFGLTPMDPATYLATSAGLTAVALLATWLPARRASRVDPVIALRASL
jgi:hypothetical protein